MLQQSQSVGDNVAVVAALKDITVVLVVAVDEVAAKDDVAVVAALNDIAVVAAR